jgi:dolichyl-phosphate beta-glucosyltransferase
LLFRPYWGYESNQRAWIMVQCHLRVVVPMLVPIATNKNPVVLSPRIPMLHTTIIVPCFNEEHRLPIEAFSDFVVKNHWVQFLMVNDGSSDETAGLLKRLQARHPGRISVLNLGCNVGKAEAVRRGMRAAFVDNPRFVGYWDADLAAPLEELHHFREVLERRPQIHLVIGCRMKLLGHRVARTRTRCCLGRLFAWTAAKVLGLPVSDTQAGHKMFRVSGRLREVFDRPFRAKWVFDVEILSRWIGRRDRNSLRRAGESIYELPLESWHDVPGSKLKPSDFARAFCELVGIAKDYLLPQSIPSVVPDPKPDWTI